MSAIKIFVTGANGQLGRELRALAPDFSEFEFFFFDRDTLPIDDPGALQAFFSRERPAWCINCAAYTAVDKAESEKETAFLINGDAVGYIADVCRQHRTRLLHLSTDYVFDGNSATPLKEGDTTGPVNSYGASKLEGERQAMIRHPTGTIIIRTAWVYSQFGNNFVKTMIRLMTERPAISVVDDQVGSPTYAADLALAILQIAASPAFTPGIFHYSNEGRTSWYEFALAIRDQIGSACTVQPIPTTQFPTPAKRPHYSLLDKSLIRNTYHVQTPDWASSLTACLAKLR